MTLPTAITETASRAWLATKVSFATVVVCAAVLLCMSHYSGGIQITLPIGGSPMLLADAMPDIAAKPIPAPKPTKLHADPGIAYPVETPPIPARKPSVPQ